MTRLGHIVLVLVLAFALYCRPKEGDILHPADLLSLIAFTPTTIACFNNDGKEKKQLTKRQRQF